MENRRYIAIDLKSFYASVECVQRGLDPLNTNLVVADPSRTEKTICLAVSPSLKSYGIPGRPRLFEVVEKIRQVNAERKRENGYKPFEGKSHFFSELDNNPALEVDYIVAPPQMLKYEKISSDIYSIYLKYIAPEDIHVYSIDEVFIDATNYLTTYKMTAHELAMTMIRDVLSATGITATAGIGTNMYLCKIAMDIVAKKMPPDKDGVRIAELDEMSYREQLWDHRPITSFWRIGNGYARKLEQNYIYTMGDIARCSIHNEDFLYKLFGINAELLIDHAWGWEPCTIDEIKSYRPSAKSMSEGQVLSQPYNNRKTRIVIREMTEKLVLKLVEKGLVTNQIDLTVGYDIENLTDGRNYTGEVKTDWYGRSVPKSAHSTENIGKYTSSTKLIMDAMMSLFDRIVNPDLLVRRMYVAANHLHREKDIESCPAPVEQMSLFVDYEAKEKAEHREEETLKKEKEIQHAILDIQKKYGRNAILKGTNLQEGATAIERNKQIGGHKAE